MSKEKSRVIGFCCNECAYAAADLAGQSGMKYPANVRIIRTPCSGTTDPLWVLEALAQGAKGVFVSGCLLDQCHYGDGNIHAQESIQFLKAILKVVGVNPKYITLYLNSAGMPEAFSNSTTDFVNEVNKLPKLPNIKDKIKSDDKRERFLEILLAYAKAFNKLDELNGKPISREGFGNITIDEPKCVSCGACANLCETKAITSKETKNHRKMYYAHYLCTGCEACVRACPTDAITVKKEIHLKPFLIKDNYQFSGSRFVACTKCGTKFATERIMEQIKDEFELMDSKLISLCPICRREVIGEDFVNLSKFLASANIATEEEVK
ncbi:MAG: hydrogenase iron-sulfur subunit [Asgard group archaeon]|nr:hydrogenase iron-sulfur subunit [Asgard group archaeon]